MHRLCRDIDITDVDTVLPWVEDCVKRHWKRHDFRDLLAANSFSRSKYYDLRRMTEAKGLGIPAECRGMFYEKYNGLIADRHAAVKKIAETACGYILVRRPELRHVYIKERVDKTTGKVRLIGNESAMQQVLDYIAVYAAMPIFERRIVPQQASSIKGRGQVYGMRMIKKWVTKDSHAAKYAKRHGLRYIRKCRYFVKTDVKKCFNTARVEVFMRLFERDCKNADLLWLWQYLLSSHHVNGCEGFMIGALPSQWAVQYMMSFAYRHVTELHTIRRGKRIQLVNHMVIFMDDMAMFSSSRKHLKKAVLTLRDFLLDSLSFTLKDSWHIREIAREGIDMMGFVIHQSGKVSIRARDFIRARRMALKRLSGKSFTRRQAARIASYKGYFKHTDSRLASQKYCLKEVLRYASRVMSAAAIQDNAKKREGLRYVYKQCTV